MKFVLFSAWTQVELQEIVNEWLKTHPVRLESMRFEYAAVPHDGRVEIVTEYSLALFYLPLEPIGQPLRSDEA
jgi:hypothetical protein